MCILNELLQYAYIFDICDTTDPRVIIIVTTTDDIKNNLFNTGCFSKVVSTPTPEKKIPWSTSWSMNILWEKVKIKNLVIPILQYLHHFGKNDENNVLHLSQKPIELRGLNQQKRLCTNTLNRLIL